MSLGRVNLGLAAQGLPPLFWANICPDVLWSMGTSAQPDKFIDNQSMVVYILRAAAMTFRNNLYLTDASVHIRVDD